jgi:membrane protein implicated in regulation of membrane protease activity
MSSLPSPSAFTVFLAIAAVGFLFLLIALLPLVFGRVLDSQQATSAVRSNDLIGQTARVVIGIPARFPR